MTEKVLLTNREKVKVEKSGADFLMDALKKQNVDVIFGYPGGAVLPIYDKLYSSGLFHILTRHEQGSIHAAEGYARVTGKPGVVIATSGPGATNVVTGNGQRFNCTIGGRNLIVFYSVTTRSIPPQTTPRKIIVMC